MKTGDKLNPLDGRINYTCRVIRSVQLGKWISSTDVLETPCKAGVAFYRQVITLVGCILRSRIPTGSSFPYNEASPDYFWCGLFSCVAAAHEQHHKIVNSWFNENVAETWSNWTSYHRDASKTFKDKGVAISYWFWNLCGQKQWKYESGNIVTAACITIRDRAPVFGSNRVTYRAG